MLSVTARLKVVTPVFMGGADKEQAELRPSSFKGLLRFWFRALHDHQPQKEAQIFGSVTPIGPIRARQASFLVRISDRRVEAVPQKETPFDANSGYLGYGPVNYDRTSRQVTNLRQYIRLGGTFSLSLCFRETQAVEGVLRSLWALCFLGGVGSRCRRGYGSIELLGIEGTESLDKHIRQPANAAEYLKQVQNTILKWCPNLPPPGGDYTLFSHGVRIAALPACGDALTALRNAGIALKRYRSEVKSDSQLVRSFLGGKEITLAPQRTAFGLPHNYFFRDDGRSVSIAGVLDAEHEPGAISRRASPLFIHVHHVGEGYIPVFCFFPSAFLPTQASICMKVGAQNVTVPLPGYEVIEDFFGCLRKQHGGQEVVL